MEVDSRMRVDFGTKSENLSNGKGALSCSRLPSWISQFRNCSNIIDRRPGNKVGGWKAMPYIIGNELCEKLATIALFYSLVLYLVNEYHLEAVTAANIMNIVSGTSSLAPLVGGFLADTYLGRFRIVFFSSFLNLMGMVLLVVSATVASLRPASCPTIGASPNCSPSSQGQLLFLYAALFFIVLTSGGLRSCAYAFGADQFSQNTAAEKKTFQSFSNWYFFVIYLAILLSGTVIVYLQQVISWGWGFGIPAIAMSLSIVIFVIGTPLYKYVPPEESPLKSLARVIVAAYHKRNLPLPSDSRDLFETREKDSNVEGGSKLDHTDRYGFFDKAAIVVDGDLTDDGTILKPWRLCTVHQVEELKVLIRMVPIWSCGILQAVAVAQQGTFLILQANSMDRRMGAHFTIPAGSVGTLPLLAMIVWLPAYDRVVLPLARRATGQERGITFLQRIGVGYGLGPVSMVLAGVVEARRKSSSHKKMSVFWLFAPLLVMGVGESFNGIGQTEFFYDEVPVSMRSLAGALGWCSFGVGSYASSLLLSVVRKVTKNSAEGEWLNNDLNLAHLDYFYYLIASLLVLNFVCFLLCANFYTYKAIASHDVLVIKKEEEEEKEEEELEEDIETHKEGRR